MMYPLTSAGGWRASHWTVPYRTCALRAEDFGHLCSRLRTLTATLRAVKNLLFQKVHFRVLAHVSGRVQDMNGTTAPRGDLLRRLVSILLPIFLIGIGIAAVRGGLGIPQNPLLGMVLLVGAAAFAVRGLLRAGRGRGE